MKKLSKLLAVVLAVAMILAFAVPASAATGPALYATTSVLSYGQSTSFYMSDGTPILQLNSDDPDDFMVSGNTVTCMARGKYGSTAVGGATISAWTSKGTFTAQVFTGSFPTTTVMGGTQSIQVGGIANFSLIGDSVVYVGTSDHSVAKPYGSYLTGVGNGTCTVYLIGRNGTAGSATLRVGTGIGGNTGTGTGTGTMVTGNGAVLVNSNIAVGGTTQIMATNGGTLVVESSNPMSLRLPAVAAAQRSPAFRLARRRLTILHSRQRAQRASALAPSP